MYKRIDFTKLEGLATYQDTLDFLQTSYRDTISAIAKAFGNRVIVTGVTDQGATFSDGWVMIDGELMPFLTGMKSDLVIVEELTNTEVFGNGSTQTVYYTKRAKLGNTGGFAFSDFIRVDALANISEGLKRLALAHNNLKTAFDIYKPSWGDVQGKPLEFTPSYHTHPWDQVTGKPTLPSIYFGVHYMGNGDSDADSLFTVNIPDQGTTNYRVAGTLVSYGDDWNLDNDVIWMIRNKQNSYFELLTREVSKNRQYLRFEYMVIKL